MGPYSVVYTTDGSQVTQWTEEGNWISDTSTGTSGVNSLTFSTYLYMGQTDGDAYYAELVDSVETDKPLGVTYSGSSSSAGEALWVILDASPKDKILKMNTTTPKVINQKNHCPNILIIPPLSTLDLERG